MELEEQRKFFHGTLEITIFDATPFSPSFPFNVSLYHMMIVDVIIVFILMNYFIVSP